VRDIIAGASVGLVLIPQSMAYADLAGLPAHYGLYASALPPIAAAFFASSPYLQTGPVALTALLTLGALTPLAATGTPEYVGLAALLALIVGLSRVLVGVLRAGGVAYMMSQPVLMGFTAGAALLILSSQLPAAVGLGSVAPAGGVLQRAGWALGHVPQWEVTAVLLSLATIALILGSRRIHPLVPGVLLATVGALFFSLVTDYRGAVVGEVPAGLPTLSLAMPWSALPALVIPGVVIALVGFAEAASISRTFATQDRAFWDPDREFVSQGVANLASGLSGGFPVGGSFSRSSINRLAGARTRWSGAVTGVLVLAFLPFASLLAALPRAVLAAIVIAAVFKLIQLRPMLGLWRLSKPQTVIAWTTFGLTLVLSPRVDQAILVGVVLSLGVHAWREMKIRPESWREGETLHLRPHGVLWFGSSAALEQDLMEDLKAQEGLSAVRIHLQGLGRIDLTGAMGLKQLMEDAELAGLHVSLVEVPPHADRILGRVLGWKRGEPIDRVGDSSGDAGDVA
jgi:SulP family sulfate permease